MASRNVMIAGGVAAAGAVLIGGSLAFGAVDNPIRVAVNDARNPAPGTPPSRALLEQFANDRREYHNVATAPAGHVERPILAHRRTLMVERAPVRTVTGRMVYPKAYSSRALLVEHMRVIKAALVAAGRQREDARTVVAQWAIETGHFCQTWNWNIGNAKKRPYANPDLILRGSVWLGDRYANGVHLLTDSIRSFDAYGSYATLADYCRYEKEQLFAQSNFRGVIEAHERGGLEGLDAAATILSSGRYSPSPAAVRRADHRYIWRLYRDRIGGDAAWEACR